MAYKIKSHFHKSLIMAIAWILKAYDWLTNSWEKAYGWLIGSWDSRDLQNIG
jgi:hypothetical protein